MKKTEKKKKEKIRYIDDGRSIADMSGVGGAFSGSKAPKYYRSSAKERWQTYTDAVRRMFVPMLVVVCAIVIIYMILSVVFLFLA